MRLKHVLGVGVGLAVALALASPARTQEPGLPPTYWPQRSFGLPIDTVTLAKQEKKPTHLQLYYSLGRGPFQKGPKLAVGALDNINGDKKGILFEAPRDGDYEFAVQLVYADGSVLPRTDALAPEQRVIIDATPPRVQLVAVGNGVEWKAADDNLLPEVTLQHKWPTSSEWTTVDRVDPSTKQKRPFRAADSYAWKMEKGQQLDVRVIARDRAGHEGVSRVVRVSPDTPATPVGLPKDGGGWGGAANLPQAPINFVNTLEFDIDYTVQKMGRSGIQAAHLFVLREVGDWAKVDRYPVKLMPEDKPPHAFSLKYKADREGTYEFIILPESGAGKRADDPRKGDPSMVLVVVDTTKPKVEITGVQVKPGGVRGPVVEITWTVSDANLMPQPVKLEWAVARDAKQWNEIKYRLDNDLTSTTGRYVWEFGDEKQWKFYVRAQATDKAGNVGEHVWGKEVVVDLETPSATIDKVRPQGAPPAPKGKSD
ncbi:MAG: hypothetical protein K2V38_26930, partial [Gemmataceae bacterium]|nr:hypothetical protein [Gemmataceae bacterium]